MILRPRGISTSPSSARDRDASSAAAFSGRLSASAFNCYLDRDIDKRHEAARATRPLVTGQLSPARGAGRSPSRAGSVSIVFLWSLHDLARGACSRSSAIRVLRRCSTRSSSSAAPPQNIVWGGAAGCMPVLIGWAAVTGQPRAWPPFMLFGIVFLWTPAALLAALDALPRRLRGGARVPMLAVVRGRVRPSGLQVVLYAWATVVCSLLLIPVAPMGVLYARRRRCVSARGSVIEAHRLYAAAIRAR